jgi:hypothetical protein
MVHENLRKALIEIAFWRTSKYDDFSPLLPKDLYPDHILCPLLQFYNTDDSLGFHKFLFFIWHPFL